MADKLPSLKQALAAGGGNNGGAVPKAGKLPTLKEALAGGGDAVVVPAKKHGGGGVLGWVGHEAAQTGSDLYHAAVDAPAGLYETAKGLATHPVKTVEAYGQALAQDVEHPLRHPGYTLLDILGAVDAGAGTVARVGAAAKALEAGGEAADAARALVRHPDYGTRTLRSGNLEVNPETSRSAVGAAVQHTSDRLLQKRADRNPAGRAADVLNRKIGKVNSNNARMAEQIAKGPGAALIALGKKLTGGEQKALQVVAEQAPLEGRITATSARIVGAKNEAIRANHRAELALLHEAAPHLTVDRAGRPALAEDKLRKVYDRMAKVAGDRETLLKHLGLLTDEAAAGRKTAAGRLALGAHYVTDAEAKAAAGEAQKAGREVETQAAREARGDATAATRRARELDAEATKAESSAFNAATRRTQAEREALTAATRVDREAERASSQRFANAPRAEAGENAARLLQREQRLAQIAYERFQRGEIGAGALDRAHRRLARLNDAYERNASAVIKMRAATDAGAKAAAEQETRIQALRDAEREAAATYEAAKRRAGDLRGRSIGARYKADLVKKLGVAKTAHASAATERAMAEELARARKLSGAEDFAADENAIRIPDVATTGRGSRNAGSFGKVGAQGTIGHLKQPGSVTHGYTGALREQGLRREDTTRLVGESSLEAAKYAGLHHIHGLVREATQPEPLRPDDLAVRLDELRGSERLPLDVRKFVDNPEEFFQKASPSEAASMVEKVRQQLFINPRELSGEDAARFQQLHAEGKIGFIPKAILGDLAKPQAPLSAVVGSKPVRLVDAINNGSRFAMLYLKPAYALPNLLGNGALNLLQQGFAAVPNLARAARLNAKLGEEATARLDTVMGEGFAQAISSHGQGALHTVVDKAAGVWSKGVDTPFRRSAFLYEARREGFKTPEQLDRLLSDPKHEQQLARIAQRANGEIIDYSQLTPAEREVVRRVIYFYPWIKGSTVYAGRLLREHPIKAAVSGQVGRYGNETTSGELGAVPSYLEGVFPVGKGSLVNPNSAAILQTPAQVGEALAGLATGNIPQAAQASGFFTPALTLALAEALRTDPSTGRAYKNGTDAATIARQVLGGQLPQMTLYKNLHAAINGGKGGSKLYPPSVRSALLQFLVGGLAPRPYDQQDLNRLGRNEQAQLRR